MEASKYQKRVGKLGELLKGKFELKKEHTDAFGELKDMLSCDTVQAYFDPQAEHELYVAGVRWDWPLRSRRGSAERKFGKLYSTLFVALRNRRNGIARSS